MMRWSMSIRVNDMARAYATSDLSRPIPHPGMGNRRTWGPARKLPQETKPGAAPRPVTNARSSYLAGIAGDRRAQQ
jgi:hypothetical protein